MGESVLPRLVRTTRQQTHSGDSHASTHAAATAAAAAAGGGKTNSSHKYIYFLPNTHPMGDVVGAHAAVPEKVVVVSNGIEHL